MKASAILPLAVLLGFSGEAWGWVAIETVPVGNPGNAGELSGSGAGGFGPDRICGAVDYEYNIGKYEVTAGQYCEFLNAVAATDTYGLYNPNMDYDADPGRWGCNIKRSGSAGGYTYSVAADWANRPVNYVNWGDAARFANWLHNGQPTGLQGLTTTEDGAYYLNGATSNAALLAVSREADWKWAITSEDEWYKAAYYNPETSSYYDYPTSSNSVPSNDLIDPDPGNNATFFEDGDTYGIPYYRTEVGAHENSDSPHGTYDQGGNVWEWNETILYGSYRGQRGGSFYNFDDFNDVYTLHAADRYDYFPPRLENVDLGFRVVQSAGSATVTGDANNDGVVDAADYIVLKRNFGITGSGAGASVGDFDDDGNVDWSDLQVLMGAMSGRSAATIPEPASLSLLAVGGLAMMRRRGGM